jgi:SAM-dependent methyltransferase
VSWSPYYKVETESVGQFTKVTVNGVPHQAVMPLAQRLAEEPFYRLPYARSGSGDVGDVLVIGAGTGTDVGLALDQGARSVTAVEIDPRIQQLGVEANPDRAYDDPRVNVVIDDGRAFLQRTDQTFDRIVFALPDSLTLVAGASQLRLESYLFTEEGLRAARDRLRPGGSFAMYNFYREDWLIGRLATTARDVFGHDPCVDTFKNRSAVITVGLTPEDQRCGQTSGFTETAPVHDDRPFLYLREPGIPAFYLVALGVILVISLVAVRAVAGPLRRMRPYTDLFLLGAAFLLMETKAVTGFALLFGTTWVVNAVVFGGILVAVLVAVEVTRRMPRRPPLRVSYAALAASLVLAWVVPASWLLGLPVPLRILAAVTLAFLPVFTANVVFATRFADTEDGPTAFGANLLGAMVGGCLEYAALLVGYPSLLLLAALLYVGAFLARPRSLLPTG